MSLGQAVVLGLVQGLTEFLPVSSSGHLVIVPALLGWEKSPVAFDALLHGATLLAVLIYFRRELFRLLRGVVRPGKERRLVALIAIATIPAALFGLLFRRFVEDVFAKPVDVSLLLIVTGLALALGESIARWRSRHAAVESVADSSQSPPSTSRPHDLPLVSLGPALMIGAAQAVAVLPGLSRSGWTISAGLAAGIDRPRAARFSFLLAIPVLVGALVLQLPDLGRAEMDIVPTIVGGAVAFFSGYAAIAGLIGFLQRRGLVPFAVYCIVGGFLYHWLLT